MNIVIVTHEFPPYSGGIGNYCFQLAQSLAHCGHSITVVTPQAQALEGEAFCRIKLKPVHGWTGFFLEPVLLWRILSKVRADAVLITHSKMIRCGSVLALWSNVSRMVPVFHGTEIRELAIFKGWFGKLKRFLFRRFISSVGHTITNTKYTAGLLGDSFGAISQNLSVIYPIVDDIFLTAPRLENDRQTGVLHLLTVARIEKGKGHDLVLQAMYLLKNQGFRLKYTIVGKGSYEQELSQMISEMCLENEVVFAGEIKVPELVDVYDACDVFVMPSLIDSFGIVFLEAAARGKPVIAGGFGGGSEFVENGFNGFIVDESAEALALRLRGFAVEPETAYRMGMNGHKRVQQHFSSAVMVSVIEKVVNDLNDQSSGGE